MLSKQIVAVISFFINGENPITVAHLYWKTYETNVRRHPPFISKILWGQAAVPELVTKFAFDRFTYRKTKVVYDGCFCICDFHECNLFPLYLFPSFFSKV